MFSSNFTKIFAVTALFFLLFSGCGPGRKTNDANSSAAPPVADALKSEVPFSTKEPERFQAEIVVTANGTERRTFTARNGADQRRDFNFGAKNQLTNLQTDKNYLILPGRKIYTENPAAEAATPADDWTDFLTTEWLSQKQPANFEKLETAENLTRYRVRLNDGESSGEIFLYIDEKIGLPVKQEFYAGGGERKDLTYSFELKNLKLETDAGLFAVPAGFRLVSAEEFQKALRSEE